LQPFLPPPPLLCQMAAPVDQASRELAGAAQTGDAEALQAAISAGANPNAHNGSDEWSALMWAACRGDAAMMEVLVKAGALPDGATAGGITALMVGVAADRGRVEGIRVLKAAGADVNRADSEGCTALHRACQYGYLDSVTALLAAGASAGVRSTAGSLPLDVVRQSCVCGAGGVWGGGFKGTAAVRGLGDVYGEVNRSSECSREVMGWVGAQHIPAVGSR
jgi:ankyrin repeat protein